jgi:hypothetical protein
MGLLLVDEKWVLAYAQRQGGLGRNRLRYQAAAGKRLLYRCPLCLSQVQKRAAYRPTHLAK